MSLHSRLYRNYAAPAIKRVHSGAGNVRYRAHAKADEVPLDATVGAVRGVADEVHDSGRELMLQLTVLVDAHQLRHHGIHSLEPNAQVFVLDKWWALESQQSSFGESQAKLELVRVELIEETRQRRSD